MPLNDYELHLKLRCKVNPSRWIVDALYDTLDTKNNEDILYWASEELPIRYYNPLDKKYHRYFPDFVVKTVNNEKYMIEIKPSRQVAKPKPPKKKTKSYMRESFEYIKNQAKWQAAKSYCEDNDLEFKIISEKDLGQY